MGKIIDKRKLIKCPYCGATAYITHSSIVYGDNQKDRNIYVCGNYPKCDSYVYANNNNIPLGNLANAELRKLRMKAHRLVDEVVFQGIMTKRDFYFWLEIRLNKSKKDAHISKLTNEECTKLIEHIEKTLSIQQEKGRVANE